MSLRIQLLAFGLLTLVLPWSGFRYVQEMEAALRSGLEQSLLATATTVAAALEEQPDLLCPPAGCMRDAAQGRTIYAHPLRADVRVDGAFDDWNLPAAAALVLSAEHRVWAGVRGRYAYLFAAAQDARPVYQRVAGQPPYGDRLVLRMQPDRTSERWLLLATGAPGAFRAQETSPPRFEASGSYDDRIVSAWQETATGFSVEVRLPLALVGVALGVAIIDVDGSGGDYTVTKTSATWALDNAAAAGAFVYQRPDLARVLGQFGGVGGRFRVLDPDGWVLSDAGRIDAAPSDNGSAAQGPLGALLRLALQRDDPPYPAEEPVGRVADPALRRALAGQAVAAWYRSGPAQEAIVTAAVPVGGGAVPLGAVLLEQASDSILTLTNQALSRLMTLTLLVSVAAALGLLGYATLLSLRVRRLARAAETALGPKGEIRVALPGRTARDEIGDLARSFESLLERLRGYTEYLRTLSSKLSHELRTPLAVVSTSLDNLEHEQHSAAAADYLKRVRDGADRLDSILLAMSEATRLEQAIKDTPTHAFDLAEVVESCCIAYRDVYPQREIGYRSTADTTRIAGSGELVAQLLDKLVDNAVGFSPPGSCIDVTIEPAGPELCLSVTNRGSTLPATMRQELFDSLVSIRDASDGRPHLGLGLHIVALIAAFHRGRVEAHDLPDHSGVVFKVWLAKEP